jgi:undecaprenyl-diphosphatase
MIILFFLIDEGDRWLFHQIYFQWRHSWLDAVIPLFSDPFSHYKLVLLGLALLLILFGGSRVRHTIIFLLLAVAISDLVSSQILKKLYGIARPAVDLGQTPSGYSFPSSHAANTWAAIGFFQLENPRFRPLLWAIGSLVCFSRIYVGDHYPGDVLAGVVLGLGIGRNVYKLQLPIKIVWNRLEARCRYWIRGSESQKKEGS